MQPLWQIGPTVLLIPNCECKFVLFSSVLEIDKNLFRVSSSVNTALSIPMVFRMLARLANIEHSRCRSDSDLCIQQSLDNCNLVSLLAKWVN